MKRSYLSLSALAFLAFAITACEGSGENKDKEDSLSNNANNTESVTGTSTGNYAAMADSVERNSQQGYYLNARTGKPYSRLSVDRSTGQVTYESGEPVWRYVDSRNWWVYGYDGSNWNNVGEARMQNNTIQYKHDGDAWVDYDTKWKQEDDEWKMKSGDTKIKSEGDETKIKSGDTKIKTEGDETKIKDGDTKIKSEDGETKIKKDN